MRLWYLFDFYMLHCHCRYYSYPSPGSLVWKMGLLQPPPLCHRLSLSYKQPRTSAHTHTHTVWCLIGKVQQAAFPSSFSLFFFFLPNRQWSSSSPLSVTRVISLCYFIWLSNESNPRAFQWGTAQIMRAASPLVLTLSLPTLLSMDEEKQMCVWSTQSCQVLCASFP